MATRKSKRERRLSEKIRIRGADEHVRRVGRPRADKAAEKAAKAGAKEARAAKRAAAAAAKRTRQGKGSGSPRHRKRPTTVYSHNAALRDAEDAANAVWSGAFVELNYDYDCSTTTA